MKRFLLISILLSLTLLCGCTATPKTIQTTTDTNTISGNDLFEKKQKCASLANELTEKTRLLWIEFSSLWKFSFEQVFYSLSNNSCLWIRSYTSTSDNWSYTTHKSLYEYWDDSWTSDPITSCDSYLIIWKTVSDMERSDNCNVFEDKIRELKWE